MKLALLFNLLVGGSFASVLVSSDRYLLKILDTTVSLQDLSYQLRNLKALYCIFDDSMVIQYFGRDFIQEMNRFYSKFPSGTDEVKRYMHENEKTLKDIRYFFKMLRYSEDQKTEVTPSLTKLIKESVAQNNCNKDVLYKNTLHTNFVDLIELELYFRSRYGGQLKKNQKFEEIKSSIDLFVESLDKQFSHEYYW